MYHKSKVFQSSKDKSDFPSTAVDGNCMIMTVFSGQFGDLWVLPLDQACGMEHIFIYLTVSGRSRLKPGKADVSRLVKCYSRDCLLNSDGSRQKSHINWSTVIFIVFIISVIFRTHRQHFRFLALSGQWMILCLCLQHQTKLVKKSLDSPQLYRVF